MHACRDAMIELESVSKRYGPPRRGGTQALNGVSLRIPRGGLHAVVGPNGAGKTTLFAIVLGFLRPTSGKAMVDGMDPRDYARRRGAAYMPEQFRLPGSWTVLETLRGLAALEGVRGTERERRVHTAIRRLGLEREATKRLAALSHGLLQRVGLAQALLAERELVVLDEPTEGLDPLWRIRFRGLVEEFARAGRTVLLASHELSEVERLADRVVLLERGRVRETFEVRPATARLRYRIELAMPAAALLETFPDAAPDGGSDVAYYVEVDDAAELSRRLAALLAEGGIVAAVQPAPEPLEERVRRALAEGPQ